MAVPFADLLLQYQSIKSEVDGAIAVVIRDNAFIRGPYIDAFERDFAAWAAVGWLVPRPPEDGHPKHRTG
jgi:dTDP-4-amino-4,6-dideoxygalactose transaminase